MANVNFVVLIEQWTLVQEAHWARGPQVRVFHEFEEARSYLVNRGFEPTYSIYASGAYEPRLYCDKDGHRAWIHDPRSLGLEK